MSYKQVEKSNTTATDRSQDDISHSRKRRASPANTSRRNQSFDRKFQRVLTALVPARFKEYRRSRSACDLGNRRQQESDKDTKYASEPLKVLGKTTLEILQGTNSALAASGGQSESSDSVHSRKSQEHTDYMNSVISSRFRGLDTDLIESDSSLRDLRVMHPRTFTQLVAGYLNFLEFETDDLFRIADEVGKQEVQRIVKKSTSNQSSASRCALGSPIARAVLTPTRFNSILSGWGVSKQPKDELIHWYNVCNAMINYLLEEQRYCRKFIFRRPGVQTRVNELEKQLFNSKVVRRSSDAGASHSSSSAYSSSAYSSSSSSSTTTLPFSSCPASSNDSHLSQLLSTYDEIAVASTLSRILRRHGPLIPRRLHYLFLQLTQDSGDALKETKQLNNRRALRLLLHLVPSRHLELIYRPLCRLLMKIASESLCEVNESSMAVLFAPIFLLDRESTTPAALANPRLPQVLRHIFSLAKVEMETAGSAKPAMLFKVPRLFLHDCRKNLLAHDECEDPPLYCSLRYCTTLHIRRSASIDSISVPLDNRPISFGESVHRSRPPVSMAKPLKDATNLDEPGSTTPIIKRPLQAASINFRVRRTPGGVTPRKFPLAPPFTPRR